MKKQLRSLSSSKVLTGFFNGNYHRYLPGAVKNGSAG